MERTASKYQALLGRLALRLIRLARATTDTAWPHVMRGAVLIGRLIKRICLLPVYRLLMFSKLRSRRLMEPARGVFLFLATSRYMFHTVVIALTVATVGLNFMGRQARAQDAGQQSLLFAMLTGEDARSTEQEIKPELLVRDSRYVAPDSLIAFPDVDFDYDESAAAPVITLAVPGTLAANIAPHEPEEPSGPTSPRTKTETYAVRAGDTLSTIAHRFGVNVGTILWANNRAEFQYLRPGDTLKIPPVSGVLVTVKSGDTLLVLAQKYSSNADEILRVNRLAPDEMLPTGLELVLPGGHPLYVAPPSQSREPFAPSRPDAKRPASADTASLPLTKLLWPTTGRVITQYYGWRHTGVDIDGDYSSPIYAALDGEVVQAGWNKGGYGLQVVIQSPNGMLTRYAHSSKLFVRVGDAVKRGETIAMIGTTGRSTGTHLHFEVYAGGRRMNPLSYVR